MTEAPTFYAIVEERPVPAGTHYEVVQWSSEEQDAFSHVAAFNTHYNLAGKDKRRSYVEVNLSKRKYN